MVTGTSDNILSHSNSNPLAESIWFWMVCFSAFGLLALTAIGPKYARRQAQIERQYQARGQVHRDVAEGRPLGEMAGRDIVRYSTDDDTLISLRPLRIALVTVILIAAIALVRQRLRFRIIGTETAQGGDR